MNLDNLWRSGCGVPPPRNATGRKYGPDQSILLGDLAGDKWEPCWPLREQALGWSAQVAE